ncbi:MAG TPA: transporter [Chryseosolibacter sp.]
MSRSPVKLFVLAALTLFTVASYAQEQKGYHLFKPAPRDIMREFSIDRPDVTESPITVDAGHFQFEGDLLKWTKDSGGRAGRTISVFNGLYKMGLSHSWDIHIGLELFNIYQNADAEKVGEGYGATTIRLKHNFWGNDGEKKTAFGIIPYATFTSGNPFDSDMNFGFGFPFSYSLNEDYDLGAQPQIDFIYNGVDYELSYFQTVVIGGPVAGNLDFYLEGLAVFPKGDAQFLMDGGLIYNVSPNVKVDLATNVGLNQAAPTRVYLGLSFRI